jgi:hypothetical protein
MVEKTKHMHRRKWLAISFLFLSLLGCAEESGPPVVPTGKAIDIAQANTSVEFDFKIKEAYKYDVVLEVFDKIKNETGPLPKATNAHFKIRIKSLDTGQIIIEQEARANEGLINNGELKGRTTVGPTHTEKGKTELMSFTDFLVEAVKLEPGTYRVFVENVNPISTRSGRLVKAAIVQSRVGK